MPTGHLEKLRWLLAPMAALFGGMMEIRNWYFEQRYVPSVKLPLPVISVGNITVGGTGKTPAVLFLANYFERKGLTPAILTRGYGRKYHETVLLRPENVGSISVERAGDEPKMLAANLQRGMVVVDANRLRAAKLALKVAQPELFILDDAYQHRKIARDLNILTFDASDLFKKQYIVPMGRLREPIGNYARADLILITRADETAHSIEEIHSVAARRFRKPIVVSQHCPKVILPLRQKKREGIMPKELKGKRIIGFCGIARGESFKQTILRFAPELLSFHPFRDHYHYTNVMLDHLLEEFHEKNAEMLLTTEKDAARLQESSHPILDFLYYWRIELEIVKGLDIFEAALDRLQRLKNKY